MKRIAHTVLRAISRLFAWAVVIPLVSVVNAVHTIRITPVFTARLGHLALNIYLYAADRKVNGPEKGVTRVLFGANPCNRTLFELWKGEIRIIESRLLTQFFMYAEDILVGNPVFRILPQEIGRHRIENAHRLRETAGAVLTIDGRDGARGRKLMEEMGVGADDWFVCFQSRDAAYHLNRVGMNAAKQGNADIDTYLRTAEDIAERGGFAIRVGQDVSKPLPKADNPRIIDYASKHRTDFLDIYLLARCRFFLAPPTGTSVVPMLFGTPTAMANQLPLISNVIGRSGLYIPKLLRDKASGELLPFDDQFALLEPLEKYFESSRYQPKFEDYENDQRGIVDNTPDEILDLCLDMFDQLEGRAVDPELRELQDCYERKYISRLPDIYEYGPRVGPRFVSRHRDLLN